MNLISRIKVDQLAARKSRNTACATLLTTLLGEASMIGKNDGDRETTDNEVIGVVKKFIKNIDFTQDQLDTVDESLADERSTLSVYMPQQLSDDELSAKIYDIIERDKLEGPRSMGIVMKELNKSFSGQFNGKTASSIARKLLS